VNDWFPELEPPPDGLRALRARLDARRGRWWPGLALVAAALLLAVLWPRPRAELALDAGLAAVIAPPGAPVTATGGTLVERVPADVVWYRVVATVEVGP
jgi:hypothetical protein